MRNVSARYCGVGVGVGNGGIAAVKGNTGGCCSTAVLQEMRRRLRHHKGLSSTRKELLLRECHYFAVRERGGAAAPPLPAASSTVTRHGTRGGGAPDGRRTNSLHRVLRRMAEFMASTGGCGESLVPLQSGYGGLAPAAGLRRSELAMRYAEAAFAASSDRTASIVALAFGSHPRRGEGAAAPSAPDDGAAAAADDDDDDDEDNRHNDAAAAPLTSLEAVALLRWCAWHLRTALNGLQTDGPVPPDCMQLAVALMARLLCLIVERGLRGGAVETVAEELELSDVGYAVAQQVLAVLSAGAPLLPRGRVPSPTPELSDEAEDGGDSHRPLPGAGARAGDESGSCGDPATTGSAPRGAADAGWRGLLRISAEVQQALLCSQRERWERALELLLRTQRWNEWLDATCDAPPPEDDARTEETGTLGTEELRLLLGAPRPVLQTLNYVLAQHGQWAACRQIWKATAGRRPQAASPSPFAALHHPFNVDNIITALAFVNARPSMLSAAAAEEGTSDAPELPAKLLRLLLHLGVVPHRALSAAEFAALLRQSFGLPLGCGSVEGILSPSLVWRRAAAHPHRVRATLCLLCFQVVVKSGLAHTLAVEDLYAVTSTLRRCLQGQTRRAAACEAGGSGEEESEEAEEEGALGLLPATFAAATRRTAMTSAEAHICAITEVFLARRRELLPARLEPEPRGEAGRRAIRTEPQPHPPAPPTTVDKERRLHSGASRSSTVMFSLLSRELMTLLAMTPYGNAVGRTWQAALCAIASEIERDGLDSHSASAVEGLANAMAKKVLEPGGTHLLEPLLRLAPYASPFTVSAIIQSPVGGLLTWEQSLRLLPCTPWASNVQRRLLRRVVQERDVSELPQVQSLMQTVTLSPRLLHACPALATDMRMLTILAERSWCRALEVYARSESRVQWACAPHVMRLAILADVWHSPRGADREALRPLLRVAVRAIGGERVAEDVLRASLQRGMWATGIAFHQFLHTEQPELLRRNRRMEAYGAQLCKGLLSHSALAGTIAEVLKWARAANWAAATAAFIRYAAEGNPASEPPPRQGSRAAPPRWEEALFPASVPSQLSHVAHTVRYSMFCTPGRWRQALAWFPPRTLPLPLHHSLQLQLRTGAAVDSAVYAAVGEATDVPDAHGERARDETTPRPLPSPLSMSLVQIALQEKLHRTATPSYSASVESVEQTLRLLQKRGQWEQAMVVCEHALANRCFPHSASAILLSACSSSWEVSLSCFAHLTGRMRPDAVTAALALKACVQGQQWVLALRILRQSALTSAAPSPRVVDYAVRAALLSGAWPAALRVVRQYQRTSSPLLANTVMLVYVQSECWSDAVEYFYECVKRGLCPVDESLALAITASRAVSAEYSDAARVVGVIASALEDFCHVHGVVLQHVLVVYRGMSRGPVICPDPDVSLVSLAHAPPLLP
ncbi:uncharacterized protein Tco025E_07052 [Trypanosoma conorhini]|uniref:Uncharacterized protein n=1 Tax=Trypanosoma conorhini TaxID=83891 RepID=A0A422NUV5_9TRYP|nr:uncharacterized protein Tco025E_07052 [Trypanosoma conorhini]RNF09224.1 hypothetical protein Tco025E_07052 [Trypanosoma conorhini]